MTLLTVIQNVCRRVGIPKPSAVIGTTSPSIDQLLGFAIEEGRELATRDWKRLERRITFLSVATEIQGALETIAPGYARMKGETVWDLSSQNYISGPVSGQVWETLKTRMLTGPFYRYRIILDPATLFLSIEMIPVPAAGHTMAMEYYSRFWCCGSVGQNGTTPDVTKQQDQWLADSDIGILPEQLMELGIRWRWKQIKGLDYEEDYNTWEAQRDTLLSQDDGTQAINMYPRSDPVLIGAWNLPDGNYNE